MKKEGKQISKENYSKKLLALLLAGSMVLGFTGCGTNKKVEKNPILKNTILENTIVVDSDLGIMIVLSSTIGPVSPHEHYTDIVSGTSFAKDRDCGELPQGVHQLNNITKLGTITNYLTEEELMKAYKNELTTEDIIAIVARIQKEKTEEKTLTK